MQIAKSRLDQLTECPDISTIDPKALVELFRNEQKISDFLPEQNAEYDPRSSEYIIFNSKRSARPVDNDSERKQEAGTCVICSGRTTGIIDIKKLDCGYTFINKNLFPIFYPFKKKISEPESCGFHFLQWTSSNHEDNWTNMKRQDLAAVFGRLAVLEGWLLKNTEVFFPNKKQGWVSIIKNYGKKVGGSLEHDHQQIGFSSIMPGRVKQNLEIYRKSNIKFCDHLLKTNPENLMIHDYGPVQLVVPRFMKRPLNMILFVKDSQKDFIHELSMNEIDAVSAAWADAIAIIMEALPEMGREPAFNVITNTGSGIYFEFLPFTQEFGGFEHIGLYMCQMTPVQAVEILKIKLRNRRVKAE